MMAASSMFQLEIRGLNPKPNIGGQLLYTDRSGSITPSPRHVFPMSSKFPYTERGISRVSINEHPALSDVEKIEYIKSVHDAISNYHGTSISSSERSSPTITEMQSNASTAPEQFGNSTDRSSTDSNYSWDEFDKQAERKVQNAFDQIDSMLYEPNLDGPTYIRRECNEWNTRFLHLRVVGSQLIHPQDNGYEAIETSTEGSRPSTGSLVDVTEQDLRISLMGKSLKPTQAPPEVLRSLSGSTGSSQYTFLEEEVFDQEGEYEEVIAIDYKDMYEDSAEKKQLTPRRRRVGYPPITPNACLRDSVMSAVFDQLWQELLSWMRNLLRKYSTVVLEDNKPLSLSYPSQVHRLEDQPSREASFIFSRPAQLPKATSAIIPQNILNEMLLINRKELVQRESSSLHDPSDTQINSARPTSSTHQHIRSRPNTSVVHQRSSTMAPRQPKRLAPIDRGLKEYEEHQPGLVIQGKGRRQTDRLQGPERLNSPTYPRNNALPPLNNVEMDPTASRSQKKLGSGNRASSAVDKESKAPIRERSFHSEMRPSTTHAMRADTPGQTGRRASTPFTPNYFPKSGHLSMGLDITGRSLQHNQHEMSHFASMAQGIPYQTVSEDQELNMPEDFPHHSNHFNPSPPIRILKNPRLSYIKNGPMKYNAIYPS